MCKKKVRPPVPQSCEVKRPALGGIAASPTLSLLGEHGPETVVKINLKVKSLATTDGV